MQSLLGITGSQSDDNALAGGETVCLDHDGGAMLAHVSKRGFEFSEYRVTRTRYVMTAEKILGESLAAFKLRGGAGRAQ